MHSPVFYVKTYPQHLPPAQNPVLAFLVLRLSLSVLHPFSVSTGFQEPCVSSGAGLRDQEAVGEQLGETELV